MPFLQDGKVTFLLSSAVLLITTTSFLAFSISLHSAYLWLAVVFVTLIFLATFTCTYSLPGYIVREVPQTSPSDGQTNIAVEMESGVPYWITVDLPPAYDMVAGILPPSYSKATGLSLSREPIPGHTEHNDTFTEESVRVPPDPEENLPEDKANITINPHVVHLI